MPMLPFRAVLRGSIARFLPASLITIALLLVGLGVPLTAFAMDPYPLWSAILACIPWTWRNHTALHGFCFIRSNLGLELGIANQDGASADMEETMVRKGTIRHPSENLEEARLVRDLGEMEYNRRAGDEALEWISANRIEFLRLSSLRFVHFWCGSLRRPWQAALSTAVTVLALLGLRRILPALDAPGRAALLIPLITFPLIYYVVSYVEHYPLPLTWLLLLLAGYEVQSWFNRMGLPN